MNLSYPRESLRPIARRYVWMRKAPKSLIESFWKEIDSVPMNAVMGLLSVFLGLAVLVVSYETILRSGSLQTAPIVIQRLFPWQLAPAAIILGGALLLRPTPNPFLHVLSSSPLFFYTIALMYGVISNQLEITAVLSAVYVFCFAVLGGFATRKFFSDIRVRKNLAGLQYRSDRQALYLKIISENLDHKQKEELKEKYLYRLYLIDRDALGLIGDIYTREVGDGPNREDPGASAG